MNGMSFSVVDIDEHICHIMHLVAHAIRWCVFIPPVLQQLTGSLLVLSFYRRWSEMQLP